MHTLQKDPDKRPQTMLDLAEQLKLAKDGVLPDYIAPKGLPKKARTVIKMALASFVLLGYCVAVALYLNEASKHNRPVEMVDVNDVNALYQEAARRKASGKEDDSARVLYSKFCDRLFAKELREGHWNLLPEYETAAMVETLSRAASALDQLTRANEWPHEQPWYQLNDAIWLMDKHNKPVSERTYEALAIKVGKIEVAMTDPKRTVPSNQVRLAGMLKHTLGCSVEQTFDLSHNPHVNNDEKIALALRHYRDASAFYDVVTSTAPEKQMEHSVTLGRVGAMQAGLGNFEEARASLKRALELADWSKYDLFNEPVDALSDLGDSNVALGNFSEALKNYDSVLKLIAERKLEGVDSAEYLDGRRAEALQDRARCLSLQGKHSESLKNFEEARRLAKPGSKLTIELASEIAYEKFRLGDTASATKVVDTAKQSLATNHKGKKLAIIGGKLELMEALLLERQNRRQDAAAAYANALVKMRNAGRLNNYKQLFWALMLANEYERFLKADGQNAELAKVVEQRQLWLTACPHAGKAALRLLGANAAHGPASH
jgi:hypothetical protein